MPLKKNNRPCSKPINRPCSNRRLNKQPPTAPALDHAHNSVSNQQQQEQSSEEGQPRRSLPGSTNFEDYATTGWRETVDDDTSTFSLDVDRTSYFLALNWVENGYQIEPGLGPRRGVD